MFYCTCSEIVWFGKRGREFGLLPGGVERLEQAPPASPPGWPGNERHAAAEPQRSPVQAPADWDVDSERADQTTADDIIFPWRGPRRSSHPRPTPFPLLPLFCGRRSGRKCSITALTKGAGAPSPRDSSFPGSLLTQGGGGRGALMSRGNVLNQRRASAPVSSSTRRACKSQTAARPQTLIA